MDTNALIWFLNGDRMTQASLQAVGSAQAVGRLYVSPISAWEAAVALTKRGERPHLRGDARSWFRAVLDIPGARLVPVNKRIALEAASVPAVYGRGDPGDCFLIATARLKKVPIVTRDAWMAALASRNPVYLAVIEC